MQPGSAMPSRERRRLQAQELQAGQVTWQRSADALAEGFLFPQSRWWDGVTSTPRHLLVPRWFGWDEDRRYWELRDGPSDERAWLAAAYSAQTLVTRIGPVHADHAEPGRAYPGWPTSSSTFPELVIAMYRHACIYDGADVLDVGTGAGYGCGLLTRRLGAEHVTSIDVDPYLTSAAAQRLGDIGLRPAILTGDATARCGTFWTASATAGSLTVPSPFTAPRSASTPMAPATFNAANGTPPFRAPVSVANSGRRGLPLPGTPWPPSGNR
jgi:protein-L-isoaspartate O-methyltransferase